MKTKKRVLKADFQADEKHYQMYDTLIICGRQVAIYAPIENQNAIPRNQNQSAVEELLIKSFEERIINDGK